MAKKFWAILAILLLMGSAWAESEAPPAETPPPGTPNEPCVIHDLAELYRTEATCTKDGSITRECQACGALVVEVLPATGKHQWADEGDHHACADCGLIGDHSFEVNGSIHLCADCGAFAPHNCVSLGTRQHGCSDCSFTEDHQIPEGGHQCALCPYKTAHDYTGADPHVCVVCGQKTEHDCTGADPHACVICGQKTEHDYSGADPHVCAICGQKTEHDYTGADPHVCAICGQTTEHDYTGADPHVCVVCGQKTEHDYTGADPHACVVCGQKTEHDYSGADPHACVVCGRRTGHEWELLESVDNGIYRPALIRYQCDVCGVVIEKEAEPEGNALDPDTTALAVSAPDGVLTLSEQTPGQLMRAGGGMTLELSLESDGFFFSAEDGFDALVSAIGLSPGGGLEGFNVFVANAALLPTGSLRLTIVATEGWDGMPDPEAVGSVRLTLPIARQDGALLPELAALSCLCGETPVSVDIAWLTQPVFEQSGEGVPDGAAYRLDGDRVTLLSQGLVYEARLGRDAYALCGRAETLGSIELLPEGEQTTETRGEMPAIIDGRLTFFRSGE